MRFARLIGCVLLPIVLGCVSGNCDSAAVKRDRSGTIGTADAFPTGDTAATLPSVGTGNGDTGLSDEDGIKHTKEQEEAMLMRAVQNGEAQAEMTLRNKEYRKLFMERIKSYGGFFGQAAHVFVIFQVPFTILMRLIEAALTAYSGKKVETKFGSTFFFVVASVMYLAYHAYYYVKDRESNVSMTSRMPIHPLIEKDAFAHISADKYFQAKNLALPLNNKNLTVAMGLLAFLTNQFMTLVMGGIAILAAKINGKDFFEKIKKSAVNSKLAYLQESEFFGLNSLAAIVALVTLSFPFYKILKKAFDVNQKDFDLPTEEANLALARK